MAYDLEEQEQIATLKAWWNQYGNLVTWLIIIACAGYAAWSGWNYYLRNQSTQASQLYEELQRGVLAKDNARVQRAASDMEDRFSRTAYAQMSGLVAAKSAFDANDLKAAKAQLEWVSAHGQDDEFKAVARLRLAGVLLDEKAYDEGLKLLAGDFPRCAEQDGRSARRIPAGAGKNRCKKPWPSTDPVEAGGRRRQRAQGVTKTTHKNNQGKTMRIAARQGSPVGKNGATRMKGAFGVLAMVAMVTILAGCSTLQSLNPFASKPVPRNPPVALETITPTMAARTVGAAGNYGFTPASVGDSMYAAGADGSLSRVESATGRTVWRINAGMPLTAGVGADSNTIAVGGANGMLLAYDADGKQRWKIQASSEILSAPAVGQGLVVVRSLDNKIAAYDAESGARRWFVQRTSPPLTLRTAPGIALSGPTAYVAMPGGRLLALAMANGAPRWEAVVGDPRGATELERIADVSGLPVVGGRDVCAVSYQGRIGCFDAATGAPRWTKLFSSTVGVAVDERFVVATDEHGVVNAFTRDSGGSVWRNNKLANRGLSAPVSFGRTVAVGDYQGYIHFLSREDGSFLARLATDGSRITGTPVVSGSLVIFQTQTGNMVALATE
jgi:outer membrane protein assembly factor BamB